jgi:hypothetical protein
MAETHCAKCGEELKPEALTCWACGILTAAGRKAKGLPENESEDETWRRSVEAARARQTQKPAVDPDAVLRQVVAQTGTEEQLQRVTRPSLAHDDQRSDYSPVRDSARTLATLGMLLAALFALAGLLVVVLAIMTKEGAAASVQALAGMLLAGAAALSVYLGFKYLSDLSLTAADAADNARRAVLLLREQLAAKDKEA